jgi:two-component system cell cycle response regulator
MYPMPARILILDEIANNRIVLKVKMQSAQFDVDACANRADAERAMARNRPDLILMNVADPSQDNHAFCTALRNAPDTASIALIAMGISDTALARFAALDAGADDVLPRPIDDTLLLARIRSLLRVRSVGQELFLRESTSRALGFEDARQNFEMPAKIAFVSASPDVHAPIIDALSQDLRSPVTPIGMDAALGIETPKTAPDLLIIDASAIADDERKLFSFVSDLRSRIGTRLAAQLIIAPPNQPEVTALFLDLGADDAVSHGVSPAELTLRAKALIRRKQQHDQLRATVRSGLNAAITDPLTGLYNRRYLAPHLARMADQAAVSGREFAVMMLDIDHFKTINDAYGHAAGDMVLIGIADRLRENLRAIDLVARVGGEEFLVAMPRTSVRQAKLAADRLRRMVNNLPFALGTTQQPINVTISVGVAVSNDDVIAGPAVAQLCDSADQALYVAKSAGRNQVVMSKSAA